jgi:hypothetical protein
MGFFSKLKKVVNIATLGQVTFFEKQLELGGKLVKVTIDVNNEVVRIGEEIFRAAPGEVFFPGLGPLAGLLKNEIEDELIMLNPFGLVPSINVFFGFDPVGATIVVGDLIGVVQHRTMRDDEFEVARYVFGDSIQRLNEIRLTNLAGFDGRPFTLPTHAGGAVVNLGGNYVHDDHIPDLPLLIHELTHVWQIQKSLMPELFICNGALVQLEHALGEPVYDYIPGSQWFTYNLEQQAHVVEDWIDGVHGVGSVPMTLASPLFRYVNGNIRLKDNDARTAEGGSVRTWLSEGNASSLRKINPPRPQPWW